MIIIPSHSTRGIERDDHGSLVQIIFTAAAHEWHSGSVMTAPEPSLHARAALGAAPSGGSPVGAGDSAASGAAFLCGHSAVQSCLVPIPVPVFVPTLFLPPLSNFLDEPWAVRPSPELCRTLLWLQNWQHAYPAPTIATNEQMRASAAQTFLAPQNGDKEIFSRLCQLARLIFNVQFAAVNIVAHNKVAFRGSDNVHQPVAGMTGAPRELSICNWTVAKGRSLVISDMQLEDATKDNPIVSDYGCRFYAARHSPQPPDCTSARSVSWIPHPTISSLRALRRCWSCWRRPLSLCWS